MRRGKTIRVVDYESERIDVGIAVDCFVEHRANTVKLLLEETLRIVEEEERKLRGGDTKKSGRKAQSKDYGSPL